MLITLLYNIGWFVYKSRNKCENMFINYIFNMEERNKELAQGAECFVSKMKIF